MNIWLRVPRWLVAFGFPLSIVGFSLTVVAVGLGLVSFVTGSGRFRCR